jgi:glycylpeptide N-tetradecanoyltransferase
VERDGNVLAFTSFYTLPSTVISHPTHNSIKAAYSFYNYATKPITFVELIRDALVMAKKLNYDVFNALDLMENKQFLEELKFGIGDGDLQYYLYNWKCPTYRPEQVSPNVE